MTSRQQQAQQLQQQWETDPRWKGIKRNYTADDVVRLRDLPAREIDRLEAGLDLLHRLIAGQRAERVDERLLVDRFPQLLRATSRERVLDGHGTAQAHDVVRRIAALDSLPARIGFPLLLELLGLLLTSRHGVLLRLPDK